LLKAGVLVEFAEAYLAHPRSWRPNADVPPAPSRAGSMVWPYSLFTSSPRVARALFRLVAAEASVATDSALLHHCIARRMPLLLPTVAPARDNLVSVSLISTLKLIAKQVHSCPLNALCLEQVAEMLRVEGRHYPAAVELLAQLYLSFPSVVSAPSSHMIAVPLSPFKFFHLF